MRVAILWKDWTDYVEAAANALGERIGAENVLLCERNAELDAPRYAPIERARLSDGFGNLQRRLEDFSPDIILVCSWDVKGYREIARRWRRRATRVVYMDNQWLGTRRQWLGVITAPAFVRPCFDGAFATGEPQARFARRLGFRASRVRTGAITADTRKFRGQPGEKGFVFVGRLVPAKGVEILAKAYREYATAVQDPWPLTLCGAGPLAHVFEGMEGVTLLGIVPPAELPRVLSEHACLVLPSRFEPWGVVVHEAASMGLQLIVTEAVGSAHQFVEDGVNGRIVRVGNAPALRQALEQVGKSRPESLREGSAVSKLRAQTITLDTWTEGLLEFAAR